MTTNAGSDKSSGYAGFAIDNKAANETKTEKALSSFLRPEFLNRVDEIITFRALDRADFRAIAKIMLGELAEVLSRKGIRFSYAEEVAEHVAGESYSLKYGARNMRRFIETEIEDPIANAVIAGYRTGLLGIHLRLSDGKIAVDTL